MNIILIGPPGSGKGTQARFLKNDFHLAYFTLGDILRRLAQQEDPPGPDIKAALEKGELVEESIVKEILLSFLKKHGLQGVLFDGFPRTLSQAQLLMKAMVPYGGIDAVIYLEISDAEVKRRLGARLVCSNPNCSAIYNLLTHPPQKEGICDNCGSPLKRRADETEAAIARRLRLFHRLTQPVIAYFQRKGLLVVVDAALPIEKVHSQIKKILSRVVYQKSGQQAR